MEPALAGPGGMIASATLKSYLGRIVLGLIGLIVFPLLIYVYARIMLSELRARRDLRFMAKHNPQFDWRNVRARARDCFRRVHCAWQQEDLSHAAGWMTNWYWQHQQRTHLDRWKRYAHVNICKVQRIKRMRPLLFVHNNQGRAHEGSVIAIRIVAKMSDYLLDRYTGRILKGTKTLKDVETIWSFTMENGVWKVSDIESEDKMLVIAERAKALADIASTVWSS